MKKILALLLTLIMAATVLTGCSDPLYDDFENYLNVEMVDVNANYVKITEEAATWSDLDDVNMLAASVNDTLLPLVNDSLEKVNAIQPATDEVKDLKAKYIKVMDAYKAGFELIAAAVAEDSVDKMNEGNEKITEGITFLDEYNAALEALADQVGAEIEY